MKLSLLGKVRDVLLGLQEVGAGVETQAAFNGQSELLVAPGASPYEEITRGGRSFKAGTTTAIAAVVAVPSTAVLFAIYNGEEAGGRNYIIDRVWAQNAASTAVASQAQIMVLVGQVREAAPTNAMPANALVNLCGTGGADSKVRAILAATALPATTGLAGYWMPVGPNGVKAGAATTPGYGMEALINGRIIVPPGRYFAISVIANVVGETFNVGVDWHERSSWLG